MSKALRSGRDNLKNLSIKEILATSQMAKDAFKDLVSQGVAQSELTGILCFLPNASDRLGEMVPGKTDRTVTRLPAKLNRFAEEIAAIQKGWLHYDLLLHAHAETQFPQFRSKSFSKIAREPKWLIRGSYKATEDVFRNLPSLVRAYAAYLSSAIRNKHWQDNLQKALVIRIIEMVKSATGRFHLKEIQILCDAAFAAAGRSAPKYLGHLDKLYKGNPRLHTHIIKPSTRK